MEPGNFLPDRKEGKSGKLEPAHINLLEPNVIFFQNS